MSDETFPDALTRGLGTDWAILETSLKWHASCRHTHPAADALHQVMETYHLKATDVKEVTAHVHQAAIDVLDPARDAATIHQSKFSMPFVLSLIMLRGHAQLEDFNDDTLHDPNIRTLMNRVHMVHDAEVEAAYPERWIGKVTVTTHDGQQHHGRVDAPLGDPDNFLSRARIRDKAKRIAQFGQCPETVTAQAIELVEQLDQRDVVPWLLA